MNSWRACTPDAQVGRLGASAHSSEPFELLALALATVPSHVIRRVAPEPFGASLQEQV